MKRFTLPVIVLLAVVLAPLTASCAWYNKNVKPDLTAAYDCAKEEAKAASGGHMASIVVDILSQFAEAVITKNVTTTIENLIVEYGEPVVACTLKEISTPAAGSGSAAPSTSAEAEDPFTAAARDAISAHGWTFKS